MDYRIVDKPAFSVVGRSVQLSCQDNAHARLIPEYWAACRRDGTIARLSSVATDENFYGIVLDMQPATETITYMVAVKSDRPVDAEGLAVQVIPAATWAIFTAVGPVPQALQRVFQGIFQQGFPVAGYEIAAGPELEVYPPGDMLGADYRCEAWIPIVKQPLAE